MEFNALPYDSNLDRYQKQAEGLFEAYQSDDSKAIRLIKEQYPRFLRPDIPWLAKNISDPEIRSTALELADAQLTIARWYNFQDWPALAEYGAVSAGSDQAADAVSAGPGHAADGSRLNVHAGLERSRR